jgi:hypothetical protein
VSEGNGQALQGGLVDIEPPPAPPPGLPGPAVLGAAIVIALLVGRGVGRYWHRPRPAARRAARAALAQCRHRDGDPRQAAHALAAALATGLDRRAPGAGLPPPGGDPARWRHLLDTLDRLRFAREPPTAAQVRAAGGEVLRWLDGPRA